MIKILTLVSLFILIWIYGCYTTLVHPPLAEWDGDRPSVRDDCSSCHEQAYARRVILPAAAETDEDWLFYTAEPWWQDEVQGVSAASDYVEPTGPRSSIGTPIPEAAPTVPIVQPTVVPLGKSSAEQPAAQPADEPDTRRTFQRRSDATSEETERSGDSSRSRRKD
ncbi:MAG: hypothetical protein ONB12_05920 [candidate division KSB1 bacterium]|nr:hypothetical protein [candidate division KSB1 bacterium]